MENLDHITKLSQLYRLAIKDQRAILERDDVVPAATDWLSHRNGKCFACLAGAIMFNTLNMGKNIEEDYWRLKPEAVGHDRTEDLLLTLDATRCRNIDEVVSAAKYHNLISSDFEKLPEFLRYHLEFGLDDEHERYGWDSNDLSQLHTLLERMEGLANDLEKEGQ